MPGTAIYGGFIAEKETSPELQSRVARYRTYADILANTSIAAAGVRYALNLIGNVRWVFTPSEGDPGGKYADLAAKALQVDCRTPWHRTVRRSGTYRFYGFSIQEWTMVRHRREGHLTFHDIAPRAQLTCERWDVNEDGEIIGVMQRSPQTSQEIYLPRQKIMYIVDDSLNDSPEGLGLFRHLVRPAQRLKRYEDLEGFGFETDLRGIPVGYAPFTELERLVKAGDLTEDQVGEITKPITEFVRTHIRNPRLGLLLDSLPYTSNEETGERPAGNTRQWDVKILSGSPTSFESNAAAIERINREIARILGVEQLLLGSSRAGSFALSRDKTNAFYLLIEGALKDIREGVVDDLLVPLWTVNGWPLEAMPNVTTEAVRSTDITEVSDGLRNMAEAGVILTREDEAVRQYFEMLGFTPPDPSDAPIDMSDLALIGSGGGGSE